MSWEPVLRVPVGACVWKVPCLNWHLNSIVEMQSVHGNKWFFGRFRVYLVHAPKFRASITSFHPHNCMLYWNRGYFQRRGLVVKYISIIWWLSVETRIACESWALIHMGSGFWISNTSQSSHHQQPRRYGSSCISYWSVIAWCRKLCRRFAHCVSRSCVAYSSHTSTRRWLRGVPRAL